MCLPLMTAEQLARLSDPTRIKGQRDIPPGQQRPDYAELTAQADARRAYELDPTGASETTGGLIAVIAGL